MDWQALLIGSKWPIAVVIVALVFFVGFQDAIRKFLNEVGQLKTKWFEIRRMRDEVFAKAEEVEHLAQVVNLEQQKLREAIRLFTEASYLDLATRNRFPLPKPIWDRIAQNLDTLARFAVEDQSERESWLAEIDPLLDIVRKKS